jgi:bifunctional DNA-binding transcriptional regulator/antitoxin component of YhaV-PrlF toxin-antitoxin module
MKLFETRAIVDEHGRIILPTELLVSVGLKSSDEVRVTLVVSQAETESTYPQLVITSHGVEVALTSAGCQEDEGENDLTLPNTLLEAADIPEGSDLEIICAPGIIVIKEVDILDNLPDELRELFGQLGIHPGTVREVMRKEGYFV